jgi:chemotaxis protein CheD
LADRPCTHVFIGQLAVAADHRSLAIHGLGSCVALILFDVNAGVGGLAHVLLPGPRPVGDTTHDLPAKYGTSALDVLMKEMIELGAQPAQMAAALVGGARLFQSEMDLDQGVGMRNVEAIRSLLASKALALAADETGGEQGRTVIFSLPECVLRIRTLRDGWRERPLTGRV